MSKLINDYLLIKSKECCQMDENDVYRGINRSNWRQTQRHKYNKEILSKKEELLLRELGEDFFPLQIRKKPVDNATLVKNSLVGETTLMSDEKILSKRI